MLGCKAVRLGFPMQTIFSDIYIGKQIQRQTICITMVLKNGAEDNGLHYLIYSQILNFTPYFLLSKLVHGYLLKSEEDSVHFSYVKIQRKFRG